MYPDFLLFGWGLDGGGLSASVVGRCPLIRWRVDRLLLFFWSSLVGVSGLAGRLFRELVGIR